MITVLWRRKGIILATMLTTLLVVIVGMMLMTPVYTATARLRVAVASSGVANYSEYVYADRLLNTYVTIAVSEPFQRELAKRLNVAKPPALKVTNVPNTELIEVQVSDPSPALAANAANMFADLLVTASADLYSGGAGITADALSQEIDQVTTELRQARDVYKNLVTNSPDASDKIEAALQEIQLKQSTYDDLLKRYEDTRVNEAIRSRAISVIEAASLPAAPSLPNRPLTLALGGLVGLIGGLGLAAVFENLDTRLYTTEQFEAASGMPVLGEAPRARGGLPAATENDTSPFREAFRRIRTRLLQQKEQDGHFQRILITSAMAGEGKSSIAAGLALAVAETGQQVILIDADLRHPGLHNLFHLPNEKGLSSLLAGNESPGGVLQKTQQPGLRVITSGPARDNPANLLASPGMAKVLEGAAQQADLVLLDSPALLAVADAEILVPLVDGVVMVTASGITREAAFRKAVRQLAELDARVVGMVVNRARANPEYRQYRAKGARPSQAAAGMQKSTSRVQKTGQSGLEEETH